MVEESAITPSCQSTFSSERSRTRNHCMRHKAGFGGGGGDAVPAGSVPAPSKSLANVTTLSAGQRFGQSRRRIWRQKMFVVTLLVLLPSCAPTPQRAGIAKALS